MWASDVCRSHAVHGVHGVQPPSQSHIRHCHNSMQMACESAEREKREGEARGRGSSLIPSNIQVAHTTPHLFSFPLSLPLLISLPHPQHTLTPSPPLIWLTTTTTSLPLSLNLPLLTPTHTRPNPHPMHVPVHRSSTAAAARLLAFLTTTSSPCPPPPACHTCKHKQQVVHV